MYGLKQVHSNPSSGIGGGACSTSPFVLRDCHHGFVDRLKSVSTVWLADGRRLSHDDYVPGERNDTEILRSRSVDVTVERCDIPWFLEICRENAMHPNKNK